MSRRVLYVWPLLARLLAAGVPCADAAEWDGVIVKQVLHQPEEAGQDSLGPEFLQELPQKSRQPYSRENIRQSIERLYATGLFRDIRVDARTEDGQVVLTFLTQSAYFVGSVQVQGVVAPPGEAQLRNATHLELGRPYLEEDAAAAIDGLRRVLADDGYFQPQISPSLKRHPDTQQIDITFEVRTGKRARLGKIEVTGAPVFPVPKLIRQAKWKPGKPLTSEYVQDGLDRIRKLYQKENYLAASFAVASRTFHPEQGRADLELTIHAGTQISVSAVGASISRSVLKKLVPIFAEGSLDEELLEESRRNLTDYFQSRGYFDVKVAYLRKDTAAGAAIEFTIDRGMRQRLKEVRITGNRYFNRETLREQMKIGWAGGSSYGRFSSKLLAQDLAAIRALYENNGFMQVEVTSELALAGTSEKEMSVSIQIREGPQTRVGKLSIVGNRSFSYEELATVINGGRGQPYSRSVIASDGDNLLTFYLDQGFPHAQFRSSESPSDTLHRMDVQYMIEEGPREYVRRVLVDGLRHTRKGIVLRQMQVSDGLPLSQSELIESQRRLYDLGIFNQVEVAVQNPRGDDTARNVLVYLEEARRYTLTVGLGAEVGRFGGSPGDVTNVQGENEFSPDVSIAVSRLNVGGRPHTASLNGRFSTLQKRAGLTYTAPQFLNRPGLEASARAFLDETRDVRTFTARRLEGTLQFEEKRSKITTLFYRYSFRHVTVDTSTLRISPAEFPILAKPVLVGMLNHSMIRDTRDNPVESHQGMFTSLDTGLAARQFGSQASFARALLKNSSYHPIGRRLVLARASQFGVQSAFGRGRKVELDTGGTILSTEIPIAEHFFSGGGSSHRGFAVNQAGPRDAVTGFPLGGNALLLNSVELRFPVWRTSIGGVLFHDAGNVFTSIGDFSLRQHQKNLQNFNYISHALGFGLRYHTPVGPVRLDLGYNLNPPRFRVQSGSSPVNQSLKRWQLLFSIGQSF